MPGKISLQFKFGLSYILVILAVLLLLNTYPLLVSQNLVFRTKQTAMVGSVKIAEAALSGLADLTEDNVAQAMSAVEETGVSRVLVTDTAGRILYDTREGDNAVDSTPFIRRSHRPCGATTPFTAATTARHS